MSVVRTVICDNCGDVIAAPGSSEQAIKKVAREKGWKIGPLVDGMKNRPKDYCAKCVKKLAAKKVAKAD